MGGRGGGGKGGRGEGSRPGSTPSQVIGTPGSNESAVKLLSTETFEMGTVRLGRHSMMASCGQLDVTARSGTGQGDGRPSHRPCCRVRNKAIYHLEDGISHPTPYDQQQRISSSQRPPGTHATKA